MLDDLQIRINELARILGLPVSLTTPDLQSIVFSPHTGTVIDAVRSKSLLSRDTDEWVVRWFRHAGVGAVTYPVFVPGLPERQAMSRWVLPVHAGNRILGHICILDPDAQCTEAALADLSEQVAGIGRIMQNAEESARAAGINLRRLLVGSDNDKAAAARALFEREGRAADSWVIAVTASPTPAGQRRDEPSSHELHRPVSPRAGAEIVECRFEDHHAFLLEADDQPSIQALSELAPCCPEPIAAAGGPASDPLLLPRSYAQARGALRIASIRHTSPLLTQWQELGPIKVLALQEPEVLADIAHDKISGLMAAESELIDTVAHYLDHGRKPDLVADSLHIHRGTLYYRLRKFEDATGLDLESGTDRLTIQLSVEALRLLTAPKLHHGIT